MRHSRWLVIAASGAFLLSLLAQLPATVALEWLVPAAATGVDGTLWKGSATSISLGQVRLVDTRWKLSATGILVGRLSAEIESTLGEAAVRGTVGIGLGGKISCRSCSIAGPLNALRPAFPALGNAVGRVDLQLQVLEFRERWPTRAVGGARVVGLPLSPVGIAASPVAPRVDLEADLGADPVPPDGRLEVKLRDAGGPVQFTGLLVLMPPGSFEVTGEAKPRGDAPAAVANALAALGANAPGGATQVSLAGTF